MTSNRTFKHLWRMNQHSGVESLRLTEQEFRERLEVCDLSIVRELDGSLQGFLLGIRSGKAIENFIYQWFMTRFEDFLYIDRVVVSQSARGRGFGFDMMEEALAWCQSRGIGLLVCHAHDRPPNPLAHALCRQLGCSAIESVMLPSREIVTLYQRSTAMATP